MFKMAANFLNKAGDFINHQLENRYAVLLLMPTFALLLIGSSSIIGLSMFSADSWAYFELSKTVFNGDFYKFNTFRSYFSDEYSTSFPFGYPIAIAVAQIFFGQYPIIAVMVNICVAIITAFVIFNICKQMNFPVLGNFAIIFALLFYAGYLDEVFSGRAIPLAMLILISAYYWQLLNQSFLSGMFLGLSALIRFDFLVYAILFQITVCVSKRAQLSQALFLFLGFLLGVLPWAAYSYSHFGRVWVSDNSWVVISALPAFVLDYPAAPIVSVFENPTLWLTRLFINLLRLIKAISLASFRFPLIVIFLFFMAFNWLRIKADIKSRILILFFILSSSLTPYILVGYFDFRYFAMFLLCLSMILLYTANETNGSFFFGINFIGLTFASLILTITAGSLHLSKIVWVGIRQSQEINTQAEQIATLYSCHKLDPDRTLIFVKDAGHLTPKYGALTGMRAAFVPSNFDKMNEKEKISYFEHMTPYVLIDNLSEVQKCTNQ